MKINPKRGREGSMHLEKKLAVRGEWKGNQVNE